MNATKSRRRMHQAALLGFMAILCAAQTGCTFWTQKVWRDGKTTEAVCYGPDNAPIIHMSAEGDLCVIYDVRLARSYYHRDRLIGIDTSDTRFTHRDARRAIILTAEDVQRLAVQNEHRSSPGLPAEVLRDCVLPARVTRATFDQERVKRLTTGWREIPATVFEHNKFDRYEDNWHTFAVAEQARLERERAAAQAVGAAFVASSIHFDGLSRKWRLEIPDGKGGQILIELPERNGTNPWGYPLRVLLTPPAAVLDLTETAIAAPVIVPMVAYISVFGLGLGRF